MAKLCPPAGVLALALLLTACVQSSARRAERAAQALRSWNATAQLVRSQRDRGLVPEAFARELVRTAEREAERAGREAGR